MSARAATECREPVGGGVPNGTSSLKARSSRQLLSQSPVLRHATCATLFQRRTHGNCSLIAPAIELPVGQRMSFRIEQHARRCSGSGIGRFLLLHIAASCSPMAGRSCSAAAPSTCMTLVEARGAVVFQECVDGACARSDRRVK